MKILREFIDSDFDLAIFGLGFESRSVTAFDKFYGQSRKNICLGYKINTEKFSYQKNKRCFLDCNTTAHEIDDNDITTIIIKEVGSLNLEQPQTVLIDITVMSRHRLAVALCALIDTLPPQSKICVTYTLSEFIAPPEDVTPIKYVGEIAPQLSGTLGDPSLPTSVVLGLGYEKTKALGISNLLEADFTYAFIPESPVHQFKKSVLSNNHDLLQTIQSDNTFFYNVSSPYSTYIMLRSLILEVSEHSRPLLVPLGPKILSALSVVLGKELYPNLPVWRVSSGHTEIPVDRPASGVEVNFSIEL